VDGTWQSGNKNAKGERKREEERGGLWCIKCRAAQQKGGEEGASEGQEEGRREWESEGGRHLRVCWQSGNKNATVERSGEERRGEERRVGLWYIVCPAAQ